MKLPNYQLKVSKVWMWPELMFLQSRSNCLLKYYFFLNKIVLKNFFQLIIKVTKISNNNKSIYIYKIEVEHYIGINLFVNVPIFTNYY